MAVPNVMFEIGFARALRYPIVFFVNRDAFSSDEEKLRSHLEFIGLRADRPLPTDLGDLEYFEYSSKIKDYSEKEAFQKHLNALLDALQTESDVGWTQATTTYIRFFTPEMR